MAEKVCPIPSEGTFTKPCIMDECAWWDKVDEQCSIVTLADSLSDVYMFIRQALKPRDWPNNWGEDSEDEED